MSLLVNPLSHVYNLDFRRKLK